MDMNHLDKDFAKLAEFFLKYKESLLHENNDALKEQTKSKIVLQFWNIIQKTKSISSEMKEYSDLIVKKTIYCLNKYSDKTPVEFCKVTYSSIINELKGKADTESFEIKTGMHIPYQEDVNRKRIAKAYKQYITFKNEDKKQFIEYAVLYLGFDRKDLEEYLFPKQAVSLFAQSRNDDEYCVADKYVDTTKKFDNTEVVASIEHLKEYFKAIDQLWLKQKKDAKLVLSELLTRELLADFKKNTVSVSLIEILREPSFICEEMVESFFSDLDYELPTQQEIGQKYGITKSAASVKLTRFIAKLKQR